MMDIDPSVLTGTPVRQGVGKFALPGLKLSMTSFIIRDDYVPAIRFAARRCGDIALLLLEAGDDGSRLPSKQTIREIGAICADEGVSLHVHLPTDGTFDTPDNAEALTERIKRAVETALPLDPSAYVIHVVPSRFPIPGKANACSDITPERRRRTAEKLADIADLLPSKDLLCIENIENFPPEYWDCWVEDTPYSRCIDIGHLWKEGRDPVPFIRKWLPRTKVIHIHGLDLPDGAVRQGPQSWRAASPAAFPAVFGQPPKDHVSLRHIPDPCLDDAMHLLWDLGYSGILNIEVFDYRHFVISYGCLVRSRHRYVQLKGAQA